MTSTKLHLMGAIGDGSDAREPMRRAVSEENETISVYEGIYTLKEIPLQKNTRIIGEGRASVLKMPTDLTTAFKGEVNGVAGASNAMFAINRPIHVTFENLTFDGDFFNQSEPYNAGCFLRIYRPTLKENEKIIVTFKNCQFINNNHSAINVYGTDQTDAIFINVYDCYFSGGAKGTTQTAIPDKWAQGFSPYYISCYDNVTLTIDGNKFIDDILPDNVENFGRIAINTTVSDTTSIANSDKYSTSMFITNNVFENLGRNAAAPNGLGVIDMYVNGENVVITGNKFINSQMQSIRGKVNVKNLVASNNVIQGGLDGAIAFQPNNYASKKANVVIGHNVVENTKGFGVLLNADSPSDGKLYFENVIITGNLVNGITEATYRAGLAYGVFLKNVRNATVADNQFINILNEGIYTDTVDGLTVANNIIQTTTNEANFGRGIFGRLLLGSVSLENNKIQANTSGVYITFLKDDATNINRSIRMIQNHLQEVRNVTSQAVYIADFSAGVVSNNIVDGMQAAPDSTAHAFNFRGNVLSLIGNVYADISGRNNDPTGSQNAIKLKGNVTNLKESNNSWQ